MKISTEKILIISSIMLSWGCDSAFDVGTNVSVSKETETEIEKEQEAVSEEESPFIGGEVLNFVELPASINNLESIVFAFDSEVSDISVVYKVEEAEEIDCRSQVGYSDPIQVNGELEVDLSSQDDGELGICVLPVVSDEDGSWEAVGEPLEAEWYKDTSAPEFPELPPVLTNQPFAMDVSANDDNSLSWEFEQISGPGTLTIDSEVDAINPVITASANGDYEVKITVTDAAGNSVSQVVTYTWDPKGLSMVMTTDKRTYSDKNIELSFFDGVPNRSIEVYLNDECIGDPFYTFKYSGPYSRVELPDLETSGDYSFYAKYKGSVGCNGNSASYYYRDDSAEITDIIGSNYGLIFHRADGSVSGWSTSYDMDPVYRKLESGVERVEFNGLAFAALMDDGSVVGWGSTSYDGYAESVADEVSSGVAELEAGEGFFLVTKVDGSKTAWGGYQMAS